MGCRDDCCTGLRRCRAGRGRIGCYRPARPGLRLRPAGSAGSGRHLHLRQLRLRGECAGIGAGHRSRDRTAAVLRQRAPRCRLRLAGLHRGYERARESVARFRRRRGRPGRRVHPQHHRLAEPARRRACRGDVVVLDIEHHANLLPWRRGTPRGRGRRHRRRDGRPDRRRTVLQTRCAARRHGRIQRHRRGTAAGAARRPSRTRAAPASSSTPPSWLRIGASTPLWTRSRLRHRLPRVLRAQALRPVRCGRARRPPRLARRRPSPTWPAAARCAR